MCENSSSRACSKEVGVDGLRGSERFLAMQGHSSLVLKARGTGQRRRNVIEAGERGKGPRPASGGGIIRRRGGGVRQATHRPGGGWMGDEEEEVYGPERAQRPGAMLRALAPRIQALHPAGPQLDPGVEPP